MKGANKLASFLAKRLGYKMLNDMKPQKQTTVDELRHFVKTGADELPPRMEQLTLDEISRGDRSKIMRYNQRMAEYRSKYVK